MAVGPDAVGPPASSNRWSRALEKALAAGRINQVEASEVVRRMAAAEAAGEEPSIADVLAEVTGLDRAACAAFDDRSLEGQTLGGFELVKKVGEGGMGSVFEAVQASLGRMVAVKVIDPALALIPTAAERFRRESRVAARLQHPHVVAPVDFGEEGGHLYFVMEWMDGGSLARKIHYSLDGLEEQEALEIARAVAEALAYAEEEGIVHRDVKPDDILFTRRGVAKLADLGLAIDPGEAAKLTQTGVAMGSPHYMSVEQALTPRDIDHRSDLYSLGITLFEALSGRPPFDGPSAVVVVSQHVSKPLPLEVLREGGVREPVVELVGWLCAKDREQRPQHATEVVAAIDALLGSAASSGVSLPSRAPSDGAAAPGSGGYDLPDPSGSVVASLPSGIAPAPAPHAAPDDGAPSPPGDETAPAPRRALVRGAGVASLVIGAALLGALAARWVAPAAAPASVEPTRSDDVAAETPADAVAELTTMLMARRSRDGLYGFSFDLPCDPWTASQVLAAYLVAEQPPPEAHLEDVLAMLRASALRDPGGQLLGWNYRGFQIETSPRMETTAWAAIAVALARTRLGPPVEALRVEVLELLLRLQLPDGAFPTVPSLGADTERTPATALGLMALVANASVGGAHVGASRAIERCAARLLEAYDREGHGWPVALLTAPHATATAGFNEQVAVALFEARAFLSRRGADVESFDVVLRDYADAFVPRSERPVADLGEVPPDTYVFRLADGTRSSVTTLRFVQRPWRQLVAGSIAVAKWPSSRSWAKEAARLAGRGDEVRRAFRYTSTFPVAETLFAAGLLAHADGRAPLLGEAISGHYTGTRPFSR